MPPVHSRRGGVTHSPASNRSPQCGTTPADDQTNKDVIVGRRAEPDRLGRGRMAMTAVRRNGSQTDGNAAPARAEDGPELSLPDVPPAEVLETLGTAQQVMAELAARELRFGVSEHQGQIRVNVVTSEGTVVQEIPTRDAVEILSGAPLPELGIDAVG